MPLTWRSRNRRQPFLPVLLGVPCTGVGQLAVLLSAVLSAAACDALPDEPPVLASARPPRAPPAPSNTAAVIPAVQRSRLEGFQPFFGCGGCGPGPLCCHCGPPAGAPYPCPPCAPPGQPGVNRIGWVGGCSCGSCP